VNEEEAAVYQAIARGNYRADVSTVEAFPPTAARPLGSNLRF